MAAERLANVISCHAWSQDGTTLAVCPNNHEVHVFEAAEEGRALQRTAVLEEHSQLVTSIDWGRGDQLVSCSHDSTAYVWSRADRASWTPELVFTRINRAALCVRWSPCGRKFALGTGERRTCVCYHERQNSWWAAKLLRRCHDSSVVSVAWHPGGTLLASTSTDGRCRVFNAAVAGVDDAAAMAAAPGSFGEMLMDIEAGQGWGTSVAWSPSGEQLVASSHGSALHFVAGLDASCATSMQAPAARQLLALVQLPMRCVAFLSETQAVAGGFDGQVFLFERSSKGAWALAREVQPEPDQAHTTAHKGRSAAFSAKLALFKTPGKPQAGAKEVSEGMRAPHGNCIVDLQLFRDAAGAPTGRVSTAGWDGRVITWDASREQEEAIKAVHTASAQAV